MTKATDKAYTSQQMEWSTKAIGKKTSEKAKALKFTKIIQNLLANSKPDRNMAKDILSGQMERNIKGTIKRDKLMDLASSNGQMANTTKEIGSTINKEGKGVFKWVDGNEYDGQWLNGKQHGEGMYSNLKGEIKKGQWDKGKRVKWL